MPKLTIDGRVIEVGPKVNVLAAAELAGIRVPHFCYHHALGAVGACRLCAVKFLEGPVKGLQMSCMVEAKDGMVVSTTDPEAADFRRWIIECLMLNHPHDCPVCDEGGECLLQDMTVSGGHGLRRYVGRKRTYRDQDLGPFVQHEMNRCIHCWRCRRFYQEYAGYRDLGAMQIGNRTYFGRFESGFLESPFAGNLVDICPTGVYTDKPSRYKGRRWDFERAPSVCLHCSLGCNTIGSARFREMMRVEGRRNDAVNSYFICDRGRYGFGFVNHSGRPRSARVNGSEVGWDEGVAGAAELLRKAGAGAGGVVCLGSARSSLETQAQLARLCETQGWAPPRFFADGARERKVRSAVRALAGGMAASLADMRAADFVLVVGADPVNEAPALALALRQASRKGAGVAVLDPRPVELPLAFEHIPAAPWELNETSGAILRLALRPEGAAAGDAPAPDSDSPVETSLELMAGVAERLRKSKRPILVCGTDIVPESTPTLVAELAQTLRAAGKDPALFYLLPGPNAFGAALLSGVSEPELLEAVEKGETSALVLVEADPFCSPDHARVARALDRLECLIALDYLPSSAVERAHAVLPTATPFEAVPSHFVSQEGRLQTAFAVYRGGISLSKWTGGRHPPRAYGEGIPGIDPRPAPIAISELSAALGGPELGDPWPWIEGRCEALVASTPFPPEGFRVTPPKGDPLEPRNGRGERPPEGELEVLAVDWTFGTEELSSYSALLRPVEGEPFFLLHTEEAARLGLFAGGAVRLDLPGGALEGRLQVSDRMARGVLVLPRHRKLEWQLLGEGPVRMDPGRVKRG